MFRLLTDTLIDLRNAMSLTRLRSASVECHHHEVATAGQCEIDFRFSNMLHTADNLMLFKYSSKYGVSIRQNCRIYAETALCDNGSGMRSPVAVEGRHTAFAGDGTQVCRNGKFYISRLLKHALH